MRKKSGLFYCIMFLVIVPVFMSDLHAQQKALLLIDIQHFYFPGGSIPLDHPEAAADNAAKVLEAFRTKDMLVVHVRHKVEVGGDIHRSVSPIKGEPVISKDQVNAFLGTKLDSILKVHRVDSLVLCGMQTHMCLEAATRAASDLGYGCTVIEDACATRSLKYGDYIIEAKDVHLSTLATLNSYADIMTCADFLKK